MRDPTALRTPTKHEIQAAVSSRLHELREFPRLGGVLPGDAPLLFLAEPLPGHEPDFRQGPSQRFVEPLECFFFVSRFSRKEVGPLRRLFSTADRSETNKAHNSKSRTGFGLVPKYWIFLADTIQLVNSDFKDS